MKAFAQSIHNWLRGVEKKINKALIKREVKKHERAKMEERNRWKILVLIFFGNHYNLYIIYGILFT
jgi:hypothetical protein